MIEINWQRVNTKWHCATSDDEQTERSLDELIEPIR